MTKVNGKTRKATYQMLDYLNECNSDILTSLLRNGWICKGTLESCLHYNYIDVDAFILLKKNIYLVNRCFKEWLDNNGYKVSPLPF